MAGASFTWNFDQLERRFGVAVRHFGKLNELTAAIGETLVSSTKERFDAETGPDGEKWKPSARAMAEGGKTLTDTSVLKNSIGYEATSTEVAVGTNDPRAAIHQFGGEIKPKQAKALAFEINGQMVVVKKVEMPARAFIGISEEDQVEVRGTIHDFMGRAFGVKK